MFDEIKLPECPVCGARCVSAARHHPLSLGFDLTFSCGVKFLVSPDSEPLIVAGCQDAQEIVQMLKSQAAFLRAELARLQADPDIRAIDAARQRHEEARDAYAKRLNATLNEKTKGYGSSV